MSIPDYIAQNYRDLVADENRTVTFDDIAARAENAGDPALSAWARGEADKSGIDVTPRASKPKPNRQATT